MIRNRPTINDYIYYFTKNNVICIQLMLINIYIYIYIYIYMYIYIHNI